MARKRLAWVESDTWSLTLEPLIEPHFDVVRYHTAVVGIEGCIENPYDLILVDIPLLICDTGQQEHPLVARFKEYKGVTPGEGDITKYFLEQVSADGSANKETPILVACSSRPDQFGLTVDEFVEAGANGFLDLSADVDIVQQTMLQYARQP
tara:strand:+ start:325 stop:780 length:456 start_codon:yes stop_codon:yes gene_type:complete